MIYSYKSKLTETGNIELVMDKGFDVDGRTNYDSPELVADLVSNGIGLKSAADEYVYVICLDSANHVIGLFEAGHGSANGSVFPVREICKKILLLNGINIFVSHNHPSGNVEPSEYDIKATKQLREALEIIGIKLLDHIIVGGNTDKYYSFAENLI